MKTSLILAAIATVMIASSAEAGLRDRCAASTGAQSGGAFNACVKAGIARGEGRENEARPQTGRSGGCAGSTRRNQMNPNC